MDFSGITDGLSVTTIVTAVIAACGLLATAGFAVWGGRKVAGLFSR